MCMGSFGCNTWAETEDILQKSLCPSTITTWIGIDEVELAGSTVLQWTILPALLWYFKK